MRMPHPRLRHPAGQLILAWAGLSLAGCAGQTAATSAPPTVQAAEPTAMVAPVASSAPSAAATTEAPSSPAPPSPEASAGLPLPTPDCSAGLTPAQTEGPYYTSGSPEEPDLATTVSTGTAITLTGYVLDANCQPLANAWLDFWQADAEGEYDNGGYTLRGHQFTDAAGRYSLTTVLPGVYPGRTRHIHVKVQAPDRQTTLTTQVYFPEAAELNQADGIYDARLLVTWLETPTGSVAVYNFVLDVP